MPLPHLEEVAVSLRCIIRFNHIRDYNSKNNSSMLQISTSLHSRVLSLPAITVKRRIGALRFFPKHTLYVWKSSQPCWGVFFKSWRYDLYRRASSYLVVNIDGLQVASLPSAEAVYKFVQL